MQEKGFPDFFPIEVLDKFKFGNTAAEKDQELLSLFCVTHAAELARKSDNVLITGCYGSGKSAIFKALESGKLFPINEDNSRTIIVPIGQELSWNTIRNISTSFYEAVPDDDENKYILLWSIFIIVRIITTIKKVDYLTLTPRLKTINKYFNKVRLTPKTTFMALLEKLKKIGISFSLEFLGAKVSTKVDLEGKASKSEQLLSFDFHDIMADLDNLLKSHNYLIDVIVDRVDDFLVRKDHKDRVVLLRGLIHASRLINEFSNMKVKLFLRSDLFRHHEEEFDYLDKIEDTWVKIDWDYVEIRKYMAKRLAWNYMCIFNKSILLTQNKRSIILEDLNELMEEHSNFRLLAEDEQNLLNDNWARSVITMVFPHEVHHRDCDGKTHLIPIWDFFKTHLCLADGITTPRIMNLFLKYCFKYAIKYYANTPNDGRLIPLDAKGEYQLIKRKIIQDAYEELSVNFWSWVKKRSKDYDPNWSTYLERFRLALGSKKTFSMEEVNRHLETDPGSATEFLSFLEHMGCAKETNRDDLQLTQSRYETPIIARANSLHNAWKINSFGEQPPNSSQR